MLADSRRTDKVFVRKVLHDSQKLFKIDVVVSLQRWYVPNVHVQYTMEQGSNVLCYCPKIFGAIRGIQKKSVAARTNLFGVNHHPVPRINRVVLEEIHHLDTQNTSEKQVAKCWLRVGKWALLIENKKKMYQFII